MSLPGIAGIAQGLVGDAPCIKVYVVHKSTRVEQQIPTLLEGYPVVVEESGRIEAADRQK
jgi:hypothetical protein